MKKILSLLVVMVIIMTAFSIKENAYAWTQPSIVINSNPGHVYSAYQIFKGDLSSDKTTLSNIIWGSGVQGSALLADLKTKTAYAACNSAEDVAAVVASFSDNSTQIDEFANIVSNHLTTTKVDSNENNGNYLICDLEDGYYFIKDSLNSADSTDAFSKYIVKVANETEVVIDAKISIPTITKTFADGKKFNNVAIGETVNFKLTSNVPEMDGYTQYDFIITDNISTKFDYNGDMEIKIGTTTLTEGTDYAVVNNNGVLTITFNNFINQKSKAGSQITVTYSADLNDTATLGKDGNKTEAYLTYSNNPYVTTSTAESVKDETYTYTTALKLYKIDSKDNTIKLEDATFQLKKGSEILGTLTTNADGEANINGLAAGTYTLVETAEPDGYNKLNGNIIFTISYTDPAMAQTKCSWNAAITTNQNNSQITTTANGLVEITVPNTSGIDLPSTGGIGTIIFTISGAILMLAVITIYVVNKNNSKKLNKHTY